LEADDVVVATLEALRSWREEAKVGGGRPVWTRTERLWPAESCDLPDMYMLCRVVSAASGTHD
jgi:hypothetical protein